MENEKNLMRTESELPQSELSENAQTCLKSLKTGASLNWQNFLTSMEEAKLTEAEKARLSESAIFYVDKQFRDGHFGNLEGIDPVLIFLGIDDIKFTREHTARILYLYNKYPLHFLYEMCPDDGKLPDGSRYDKIEYTRNLLKKNGATEEELTDEYIRNLWLARETLVKLHNSDNESNITELESGPKNLTDFVRLLE
jgi:hypothetical protein